MEKKESSVEWLEWEINKRGPKDNNPPQWIKELYDQAKAMHKEEIIKANRDGVDMVIAEEKYITGEQYYNETFGGEKC
jgi:hypothetical protein